MALVKKCSFALVNWAVAGQDEAPATPKTTIKKAATTTKSTTKKRKVKDRTPEMEEEDGDSF